MRSLPAELAKKISPGDTILLSSPIFEADVGEACMDLLMLTEPALANVLWVSIMQPLGDRLSLWKQYATSPPRNALVLDVTPDSGSLSLSHQSPRTPTAVTFEPAIKQVTPPSDLTALGVQLANCLTEWSAEESNHQIVVCIDSLSALVQYTSRSQALTFLQALTTHVSAVNAISHYHIDPGAHDPETLTQVKNLCEIICTYEKSGWRIH